MNLLKIIRYRLLLLLILFYCGQSLDSINLPVYLDWRSSSSISISDLTASETFSYQQQYKVNVGLDTLFTNGLRIRLELTNQEKRLLSQTIFDHAIIDYQCKNTAIQLSMQDFGYGKGFFLNNRRTGNPNFNQNALVNYRWHGINPSYSFKKSRFGMGIGGNNLNIFMGETNYKLQTDALDMRLFGMYAYSDNQYTNMIFHLGYDVSYDIEKFNLRSGYVFNLLPESKHLPQMESWHLINEFKYELTDSAKLLLGVEHQTYTDNNRIDYLYEVCLDKTFKKTQNYLGVNVRSLPGDKAYTCFWDVSISPIKALALGLFIDYVAMNKSDNYVKIGIQTRYSMK